MFKSAKRTFGAVAALAAATIGLGFSANKADAASYVCYDTVNYDRVCVYNVRGNRFEKSYSMDVNGRYAGRYNVTCHQEHRYNYKENANGIVCFQFS